MTLTYRSSTHLPFLAVLVSACASPAPAVPPASSPATPIVTSSAVPEVAPSAATAAPQPVSSAGETPAASEHHVAHWTYAGETGVSHWGDLSPEWATCKSGQEQSPIDLVTKNAAIDAKLAPVDFKYGKTPLRLFNNGHTIQVPNSADNRIEFGGQEYRLLQFHLHSPSEHLVDGKPLELELHLVHQNDAGQFMVVGLLFKKGKENQALSTLFVNAPSEITSDAKSIEKVTLDLGQLLPKNRSFYAYGGSLTTPPCSEGVKWVVLQGIGEVSVAQVTKFRDVTHGDTVRPVQPLGSRRVVKSK